MNKNRRSKSAFFNPRALVGLFLCSIATLLAFAAFAAPAGPSTPAQVTAPNQTAATKINVPTPGCDAVLGPDVIEFLRTKPTDPVKDYEDWRHGHPNMVEMPMPVQCQSEAWRVLHGVMAQPATQAQVTSPPLAPSVGGDLDMAGGVQAYQGEVNIAVDPNNPLHLVAGANTFYRDPSAACQSPTGGTSGTFGTQALFGSSDGGVTWTYQCAPWNPAITGGISGAAAWFGSDPAMAWDNAGNAYAVYLLINQNSSGRSSAGAIAIAKSTDNGSSWSNLGVIVNNETNSSVFDDKEMIAIDTTVGQTHSHTNRMYVIWDENNVERVAFSDNGTSWTTVVMGSGTEIGGNVAVGPDGTVYAAWNHYSSTGGVGTGDSLYVAKSTDGGVTWTAPHTNPIAQHNLASFGTNNKPAAQDSRGINAFPIIDVDRNPNSAFFGKVYIAYSDFPTSTGSGNDLDVFLINSANGGTSWSAQVRVNDDIGTTTQFFPWMAVDQSDGTVNMSWIDTRNFSANNRQTQMYSARSINGGASFETNVSVEDSGANFRNGVNYSDDNTTDNSARNGNQYGDYEGMAALNRIAHPMWTDTRNFYPTADTQSPSRIEDAATALVTNCSAPTSLAAPTATAGSGSVQLSWTAPNWGTNATGGTYAIYRSTTSTFPGGTPLVSGLTATSYTDTTGTSGTTYFYFVQATNNCPGTALTPMTTNSAASSGVVFPSSATPTPTPTPTPGGNPTPTPTATATATPTSTPASTPISACLTDTTQADFNAGTLTSVDTTSSPGDVKLSLGTAALDQQQTTTSTTGLTTTNTTWVAQGFVAGVSGSLTSVGVQAFFSAGTAGSLVMEIHNAVGSGSSATPGTTVLATSGSVALSSGTATPLTFSFASPAALTSGTTYFIVVHDATGTTATYGTIVACKLNPGCNPYTTGTAYNNTTSGTGSWTSQPTDLFFQTTVQPYLTSGNLVSSVKDSNPPAGFTPTWTTLSWTNSALPAGATLTFQVAASNNVAGPFTFSTTVANGGSLAGFNGFRYLKYKALLGTSNTANTPTLNDVTVCYTDVPPAAATSLVVASATGTYGGTVNLSATLTSSGNPVSGKSISFTLNGNSVGSATTNGSGVASLSNASLTGINAGSYPTGVGASFAGDASFTGSSGTNSLTVNKANQTITFTLSSSYAKSAGTVNLNGTSDSGLAVTYGSSNTSVATVSGSTMTLVGAGSVTITADQAGNTNYNAAPSVPRNTVITGPIATNDLVSRTANSSKSKFSVSSLLANDSRIASDGSTQTNNLSITGVTAGTGNSVQLSGQWIFYTPSNPADSTTRTFTYTVSDGTSTATGTVSVTTGAATPFTLTPTDQTTAVYDSGSNTTSITLEFVTVANQSLFMEYSENNTTWTPYANNPVSTGPTGDFVITITATGDHAAAWNTAMYFRATRL